MTDKLSKVSPDGIDRTEYLARDKERFREPGGTPPKSLLDHDPYEIVETPNPNGKALVEAILTWEGEFDPDDVPVPRGSILIDAKGTPLFETTDEVVFQSKGAHVVGAMAIESGARFNVDCHTVVAVRGLPVSLVRADNPFPGQGGADVVDGALVTGGEPPRPNLERVRARAGQAETHESEQIALRLLRSIVDDGAVQDLPEKWPNIVRSVNAADRFNEPIRLAGMQVSGSLTVISVKHEGDRLDLAFRGSRLDEVREVKRCGE